MTNAAYGIYIIGTKGYEKALSINKGVSLEKADVRFPITVLTFEVEDNCDYILSPEVTSRYVSDAAVTNEYWLTKAVTPSAIQYLWLYDAAVEEKQVLLRNGVFNYFKVTQSRLSSIERKPNAAFRKQVLLAMGKMYA